VPTSHRRTTALAGTVVPRSHAGVPLRNQAVTHDTCAEASPRVGRAEIGGRDAGRRRSVPEVKLPFVPGPSDVISAVEGVREGITEALALVPRLATVVGRVESLLDRATTVVDRIEGVIDRADAAITAVEATRRGADDAIVAVESTRTRADEAIAGVGATREKADEAITAIGSTIARSDEAVIAIGSTIARSDEAVIAIGATIARSDEAVTAISSTITRSDDAITAIGSTIAGADGAVTRTEGLLGRVDPVVGAFQEPLLALAPAVRRLAASIDPDEVEAVVAFIDRLPRLMTHLDEDVLPVIGSMGSVGEDVHDLLDTMQDLRHVVKGFPGSRLFRRRGAEEIAEDEEQEAAESG
jgi:ABC-type transporter Mla subunit MlaD